MLELNYCLSVYKDLMRNVPTAEYHIYGNFVIFLPILAKSWLPWQCPLDPCNQKCLLWIDRPRKPPVISNHIIHILAISCRNSLICIYSNFSTKFGCHGNDPLFFVHGSVIDEFPDGTNPISKPNSARICCIQLKLWQFCDFLPILAKIWLPWQRPLDSCNQKCLIWIGRPRKPPVISSHILAIAHRNAFICIYSNFSPKIGCHGNAPLSLVYGSVIDEFPDVTNPISKPNSAWICCIQLKLWPFL